MVSPDVRYPSFDRTEMEADDYEEWLLHVNIPDRIQEVQDLHIC